VLPFESPPAPRRGGGGGRGVRTGVCGAAARSRGERMAPARRRSICSSSR